MTNLPRYKFLDDKGREVPDPNPLEIPVGFKRPESLAEQVRRLVRSEQLSQSVQAQGFETFEESEDFEIDDDMFDPSSPYEEVFDPVLGRGITLDEFRRNEAVYAQRFMKAEQSAHEEMLRSEALRARYKAESSRAASEHAQPQKAPGEAPTPPSKAS